MRVTRLDWDSDFFGLRIGRADIASEEESVMLANQANSLKESYDLIYVFASHGLAFPGYNAKLIDEKTVYTLSDLPCLGEENNVIVWNRARGMTDDLLHLALVSGQCSRFRIDDQFPEGSYERLYSRWIEQSVNHNMASEVFCYVIENAPRGLITLNRKDGTGTIGLVAIHEDFQRRGIGSAMMQHVIAYSKKKQVDKLIVATQLENRPGCKLYQKSGFKMQSVTDVWHWWL